MIDNLSFGELVRSLRQKKGWNGREFARRVDITPSYLSDIENSKRNAPKKEPLDRMIKELYLTDEEIVKFYDLAKKGKPVEIAEDVKEIIIGNDRIPVLCRKIKQHHVDVDQLIKNIN